MILNEDNPMLKKTDINLGSAVSNQKDHSQLPKNDYQDYFKKDKRDELNDVLSNYSRQIPTDIQVQRDSFQETFGQFYPIDLNGDFLYDDNISIFINNNDEGNRKSSNDQKQHKIDQEYSNQEMEKEISQENGPKDVKHKRTDQYLFKRRHTILKKSLMSLELRHFVKKYKSYRKDYFILILNLVEERGVLFQLKKEYLSKATEAIRQINQQLKLKHCQEKQHLWEAIQLIKNSINAVQLFCEGRISESFDLIYGVDKLTRIQDYQTAKKIFNKERERLGLNRQI